jgi:O-antigen ligase
MLSVAAWIIFCIACAVLAFARHPIYGLYFYLGSIYVHPPSRWWSYLVPDLRWALLSAAVVVLAVVFHRGRLASKPTWLSHPPAVLLTGYALLMWLQVPFALDPDTHLTGTVQFSKYLIALWFVYRIVDSKENLRLLLFAHAAGCALLGIYAMSVGRQGGRLDGVGGPGIDDSNTLAMYLASGAMCAFGLFLTQTGWRRWLLLAMGAVITEGFVLANSRGPFLGLVAGGLVLAITQARQYRRLFIACAAVAVVGFAVVVDKVFIERMFTIGDVAEVSEDADMSARSRRVIVEAQLRMAIDYPMGTGWRGTAVLSPNYIEAQWLTRGYDDDNAQRSSHNTFMTTLVEQGLLGALLYLSLLVWLLATIWRTRRLSLHHPDAELITLIGTACAGLMVVHVSGIAADYLMAEVQFWLYAAIVSGLHLTQAVPVARTAAAASSTGTRSLRDARS